MQINDFILNGLHTKTFINGEFDKVIIAVHGFSGDCDSSVIKAIANELTNHKCMVITYDLPRHGKNDNREILNLKECLDSIENIDKYVKENYKDKRICWFATSFGGYLLLHFLSNNKYNYDKIILRAPAINMDKVIDSIILPLHGYTLDNLAKSLINVGHEQQLLIDYSFYNELKENRLKDKHINKNYLNVIQGKKDDIVNYLDNEEFLNNACKNNYYIYYFEDADHRFKKPGELERIVEITRNIIIDGN